MVTKKVTRPQGGTTANKIGGGIRSIASAVTGIGGKSKSSGRRRRNHGVTYWANKVMIAKLKKKYRRVAYGGI